MLASTLMESDLHPVFPPADGPSQKSARCEVKEDSGEKKTDDNVILFHRTSSPSARNDRGTRHQLSIRNFRIVKSSKIYQQQIMVMRV